MTLLKLKLDEHTVEDTRYVIVDDAYNRAVELKLNRCIYVNGSLEDISESEWYGWTVNSPQLMKTYQEAEVLRTATKLKAIKRYCKGLL